MSKVERLKEELKAAKAEQLYVVYYSPGTFFPESSGYEVESQDLARDAAKATEIQERHGAKPHSFRYEDGNGKPLSGLHYLTGSLRTFADVPDDEDHYNMRSNMLNTHSAICIENTNSYRFTGEFRENDVILDWDGNIVRKGNDPDLLAYREEFKQVVRDYEEELERKYGRGS